MMDAKAVRQAALHAMQFSVNGQEIGDDRPGYFMIVAYGQNPESFNTIVTWAGSRSEAKMQLTNKYPGKIFTAVFVIRQSE
jgi:hypothetical protein